MCFTEHRHSPASGVEKAAKNQTQLHWLQGQSSCAEPFSVEMLLRVSDFANPACKIEGREEIQTGENLRATFKGLLFYRRRYYCTTVSGSRKILNQWKKAILKWKKKYPFIMQVGTCCTTALDWNTQSGERFALKEENAERALAVSCIILIRLRMWLPVEGRDKHTRKQPNRKKSQHYQCVEPDEGSCCCFFALLSRASWHECKQ